MSRTQTHHTEKTSSKVSPKTPSMSRSARPGPAGGGHPLLRLQRALGNRAVSGLVQAKLTVNQPGDRYEQEADQVADQVMRSAGPVGQTSTAGSPGVQRKCAACAGGQGKCAKCAEEEVQRKPLTPTITPLIQRQAEETEDAAEGGEELPTAETGQDVTEEVPEPGQSSVGADEDGQEPLMPKGTQGLKSEVTPQLEARIQGLRGGGQPLPSSVRAFFEPRFGYDLNHVQLHTDSQAADAAQAVNARAYTVGHDIFFAAGQYNPRTSTGQQLLAHELTHVIQQTGGGKPSTVGKQHSVGGSQGASKGAIGQPSVTISDQPGPTVQRQFDLVSGLVGNAWLRLPRNLKASLVDKAIEANLKLVDHFPGKVVFGNFWVFMKAGLIGFYGRLKSEKEDVKLLVTDKIAKIMAGQSVDYALGFLKGLLKGFFVDGLLGIFIAIWELIKGLKNLWAFFEQVGRLIGGFPDDIQAIIQGFKSMGQEVAGNIEPAIEELKKFVTDPSQAQALITILVEQGKAGAKKAGEKIAESLLKFFSKPGAEGEVGEITGKVIGMVLFEVLFAIVTGGGGAAVTGIKAAAKFLAKIGGKIVGSVLKAFRKIQKFFGLVVSAVKKALQFIKGKILSKVMKKFDELLGKIGEFIRRIFKHCHESQFICKFPGVAGKFHPNVLKAAKALRKEARDIFLKAYPRLKGKVIEVHHRIPLEWRRLFPKADPNRLSNLQGLAKADHLRKATDLWTAFRNTYQRLGRSPTAKEVLEFALVVDRSLNLPYPL